MTEILGSLVIRGHLNNDVFTRGKGQQGGRWYLPYPELRDEFLKHGIELNVQNINKGRNVNFELHINSTRLKRDLPGYLYAYEDPLIRPKHGDRRILSEYRKIFTSNKNFIDGVKYVELPIPNPLNSKLNCFTPISKRELHCVILASNKALLRPHPRSLHGMRLEAIRYMEKHYINQFSLFGQGWDQPEVKPGILGRAIKRLQLWRNSMITPPIYFPSWKGTVHDKSEVLNQSKLSICIENVRGSPGYLTEKIFDSMSAGCIPIFCGNEETYKLIPANCMINIDEFGGVSNAIDYAMAMTDDELQKFQGHMRQFLESESVLAFRDEHFVRKIVKTIIDDLCVLNIHPGVG